ncbi:MAG: hypothetical protein E7254_11400 [Lachnospiraceae bacterium]|nr:hypothetical protein [Lachnospiraceae bacterium]
MGKYIIILLIIVSSIFSVSCEDNQNRKIESVSKNNESVSTKSVNTTKNKHEDQVVDYLNKKILIVYFSAANLNDVDAVSGATALGDKDGATGTFAEYLQEKVGGDIAKIMPQHDYSTDYDELHEIAHEEKDARVYPGFMLDKNPENYDIIFVGYPIWLYDMPRIMYTFFARYDFKDKTIIPFNTYGKSLDGGTYDKIRELEPDAIVADGLAVEGKSIDTKKEFVEKWVPEL